jgi:hypothetical protein
MLMKPTGSLTKRNRSATAYSGLMASAVTVSNMRVLPFSRSIIPDGGSGDQGPPRPGSGSFQHMPGNLNVVCLAGTQPLLNGWYRMDRQPLPKPIFERIHDGVVAFDGGSKPIRRRKAYERRSHVPCFTSFAMAERYGSKSGGGCQTDKALQPHLHPPGNG